MTPFQFTTLKAALRRADAYATIADDDGYTDTGELWEVVNQLREAARLTLKVYNQED